MLHRGGATGVGAAPAGAPDRPRLGPQGPHSHLAEPYNPSHGPQLPVPLRQVSGHEIDQPFDGFVGAQTHDISQGLYHHPVGAGLPAMAAAQTPTKKGR